MEIRNIWRISALIFTNTQLYEGKPLSIYVYVDGQPFFIIENYINMKY